MTNTIPMHNPETNKTADVHPAEVSNWKALGWRLTDKPTPLPPPPAPPPPSPKPTLTLPNKGKK